MSYAFRTRTGLEGRWWERPNPWGDPFDPFALSAYDPPTYGNHEYRVARFTQANAWRANVRAAVSLAMRSK